MPMRKTFLAVSGGNGFVELKNLSLIYCIFVTWRGMLIPEVVIYNKFTYIINQCLVIVSIFVIL